MHKLVAGVGVCDIRAGIRSNGKHVRFKSYTCWADMINRCYNENVKSSNPAYLGCSVVDEWLTYSNFKKFHDENYIKEWQLDKDLLIEGNKVYSPETCVFIPQSLNKLFSDRAARRGNLPIGVSFHNKNRRYQAKCSVNGKRRHVGYYSTPDEASLAYQSFKKEHVISEIKKYREMYGKNGKFICLLDSVEERMRKITK